MHNLKNIAISIQDYVTATAQTCASHCANYHDNEIFFYIQLYYSIRNISAMFLFISLVFSQESNN